MTLISPVSKPVPITTLFVHQNVVEITTSASMAALKNRIKRLSEYTESVIKYLITYARESISKKLGLINSEKK